MDISQEVRRRPLGSLTGAQPGQGVLPQNKLSLLARAGSSKRGVPHGAAFTMPNWDHHHDLVSRCFRASAMTSTRRRPALVQGPESKRGFARREHLSSGAGEFGPDADASKTGGGFASRAADHHKDCLHHVCSRGRRREEGHHLRPHG